MSTETTPIDELGNWLSQTTTDEVRTNVLTALDVLQQHNPSGYYDAFILQLTDELDEKTASYTSELVQSLIQAHRDAFQQYGILLADYIPLTELEVLNQFLSAILQLPDYEDVTELYALRNLGNSPREILVMMCREVNHALDEGRILGILDTIHTSFFERLDNVLKPRYEYVQMKLDQESNYYDNLINRYFATAGNILAHDIRIIQRFPDFLSHYRAYLIHATGKEPFPALPGLLADLSEWIQDRADDSSIRFEFLPDEVVYYHGVTGFLYQVLARHSGVDITLPTPNDVLEGSLETGLVSANLVTLQQYLSKYTSQIDTLIDETKDFEKE